MYYPVNLFYYILDYNITFKWGKNGKKKKNCYGKGFL